MIRFDRILTLLTLLVFSSLTGLAQSPPVKNELRAPAYPLVTLDPNTSAWSFSNNLYDDAVRHWSGKSFPLLGVLKVDGVAYRFLGKEEIELVPIAKMGEHAEWSAKYTVRSEEHTSELQSREN